MKKDWVKAVLVIGSALVISSQAWALGGSVDVDTTTDDGYKPCWVSAGMICD